MNMMMMAGGIAAAVLAAGAGVSAILANRWKALRQRSEWTMGLMEELSPGGDPGAFYNSVLEKLSGTVKATSYAFYLQDPRDGVYRLRAIRTPDEATAEIAPSYTGLVPYKRGQGYQPSVTMDLNRLDEEPGIIRHLDMKLLAIPLKEGNGLLLAGPVRRISRETLRRMGELGRILPPMMALARQLEEPEGQELGWGGLPQTQDTLELHELSKATLKRPEFDVAYDLIQLIEDPSHMAELIVNLAYRHFDTSTVLLLRGRGEELSAAAHMGFKQDQVHRLAQDRGIAALMELAPVGKPVSIYREESSFGELPESMRGIGAGAWVALRVKLGLREALLLAGQTIARVHTKQGESERDILSALVRMFGEAGALLEQQAQLKPEYDRSSAPGRTARLELLKRLALLMDLLSPKTVGYTEMMGRYSAITAREMGLDRETVRQIAMAASLAHIGLVGLSEDLMRKPGNYTKREYERMKRHAELAAAVVETLTSQGHIAAMIRHHHERVDGWGYPDGLSGEAIPLGSRVIAVVQSFLAMIGGREYREPVGFTHVLEQLRSVAGSELDPGAVQALAGWMERKRSSPSAAGRALGPCWEMNCTPSSICSECPAYRNPGRNCWEMPSNLCASHGKSCSTCYVYTEALSRGAAAPLKA